MSNGTDWKVTLAKWGTLAFAGMFTAIAIALIFEHDKLSDLDELVTAIADAIVHVIQTVGAIGGAALGAGGLVYGKVKSLPPPPGQLPPESP